jgi:hypothetical protein
MDYKGDVLIHAFVFRATAGLTKLSQENIQWLSQKTVKAIVPDLVNRKVNIVKITFADGVPQFAVLQTLPMPDAVANILVKILSS